MAEGANWERMYSRFIYAPLIVVGITLFLIDYFYSWMRTGLALPRVEHVLGISLLVIVVNVIRVFLLRSNASRKRS
jgi:hypothetical protein